MLLSDGDTAVASGTCGDSANWVLTDDGTLTISGTGAMTNYSSSSAVPWYSYQSNVKKVVVEDGITSVGDRAFYYYYRNLTDVQLADSVTSIGEEAFYGALSLTNIKLPSGLKSIGEYAFASTSSLTSITLPEGLTSIGTYAFSYATGLQSVTIPSTVTEIESLAFGDCSSLKEIKIPDSVTILCSGAFGGCSSLETVWLGEDGASLTYVDGTPFSGCSSLKTVYLNDSLRQYGSFSGFTQLASGNPPLTVIVGSKFISIINDTMLTALANSNVEELQFTCRTGDFNYITLPDLTSCSFTPSTLTGGKYYVDEQGALYWFDYTQTLVEESYDPYTYHWDYTYTNPVLVYVPDGIENYTVPETISISVSSSTSTALPVVGVSNYALKYAKSLKTLTFAAPDSIASLYDRSFTDAENLESINGKTTDTDVKALFTGATSAAQYLLFDNTKITNTKAYSGTNGITLTQENDSGKASLEVQIKTSEATEYPAEGRIDSQNVFHYWTGEPSTTVLTISNPESALITEDDGTVIRLYVAFSGEDGTPADTYKEAGQIEIKGENNQSIIATVTKPADGVWCYEFPRPMNGATFSVSNFSVTYPNGSEGGSCLLWAEILTKEQKEAQGSTVPAVPDTNVQKLVWETRTNPYSVTKSNNGTPTVEADSGGSGDVYVNDLSYYINLSRSGSLSYGRDYVASVEFSDVLTLPDGLVFSDALTNALKGGNSISASKFLRVGCRNQWLSWKGEWSYYSIDSAKLSPVYQEDGTTIDPKKVKLTYTLYGSTDKNGNPTELSTGVPDQTYQRVTFSDGVVLWDKTTELQSSYTIENEVDITNRYVYSDAEDDAKSSVTTTVTVPMDANLELSKSWSLGSHSGTLWTGSSISYADDGETKFVTITAKNTGVVPYTSFATVSDSLTIDFYMTAGQIVSAFEFDAEAGRKSLTVIQSNMYKSDGFTVETVTGTDGTTQKQTSPQNTYSGSGYGDNSSSSQFEYTNYRNVTVTWSDTEKDKLSVTVAPWSSSYGETSTYTCDLTAEALQKIFDDNNLYVGYSTVASLSWSRLDSDGNIKPLNGNVTETYTFSLTAKDSFQRIYSSDQRYTSDGGSELDATKKMDGIGITTSNTAKAKHDQTQLASDTVTAYRANEFLIDKTGPVLDEDEAITAGSVMDFGVKVQHRGTKTYDLLPVVDHMTGAMTLMAEVNKNAGASWITDDLRTVEQDGVQYYLLDQEKTYEGVWLKDAKSSSSAYYYADSVTVTGQLGALDTLIRWYLTGTSASDWTTNITYSAYADVGELDVSATYTLTNKTWLNDVQGSRLYDLWNGKVQVLTFDKKIVSSDGDTGEGLDQCVVQEDNEIIYRITLRSLSGDSVTVNGSEIYDALPLDLSSVSGAPFSWTKGGDGSTSPTVQVLSYQGFKSVSKSDGTEWSLTTANPASPKATPKANQQYLVWDGGFTATVGGTEPAYIYIKLSFPNGTAWESYCAKYGDADDLTNTFYLDGLSDSVTHFLGQDVQARLRKGVYATGTAYTNSSGKSQSSTNTTDDSLLRYSCKVSDDSSKPYVDYYISVYNAGPGRLYLTEIEDVLPEGFTYGENLTAIKDSRYSVTPIASAGANNKTAAIDATVAPKSGTAQTLTNGQVKVTFAFEDGVYLKANTYFAFTYRAYTGTADATKANAVNMAAMPLNDKSGSVPEMYAKDAVQRYLSSSDARVRNDGGCATLTENEAAAYGFAYDDGDDNTTWLCSDVTLTRGEIRPGITKKLSGRETRSGSTASKVLTYAQSDEVLKWTVTAKNDGEAPIVDYAISDVMQSPYIFTGQLSYTVYASSGTSNISASMSPLTIAASSDGKTLTITNSKSASQKVELTVADSAEDAEEVSLKASFQVSSSSYQLRTIYLRAYKLENGNTVLTLRFPAASQASILPGGRGELTVRTKYLSDITTLVNGVYVNTAYLTPLDATQIWDGTTNDGAVTTWAADGTTGLLSVRDSAPVTVTYGYATSSVKTVTQDESTARSDSANQTSNTLVLAKDDSGGWKDFTYTLEVSNTNLISSRSSNPMTKLILIDSLPEENDHTVFNTDDARGSAFKVSLADSPDFTVKVTSDDAETTLASDQYKVQYSTASNQIFASADWTDANAAGWTDWPADDAAAAKNAAASARSLRVIITDTDGTPNLIPAGSTVRFSFTAKIADSESPDPGEIAWNSFGYDYSTANYSDDLQAAPLKVGVQIATVPTLQKKLTDAEGSAYTTDSELNFQYLIYTGNAVTLNTGFTDADLGAALAEDAGRTFTVVKVSVPANSSESEAKVLKDLKQYSWDSTAGQFTEGADDWTWANNTTYRVVELSGSLNGYQYGSLNGSTALTRSFTYNSANPTALVGVNRARTWEIRLTKTDSETGSALRDAYFALYSPDERDKMSETDRTALAESLGVTLDDTKTGSDSNTYYLTDVSASNEQGILSWKNLTRSKYVYCEVKPPNGYSGSGTLFTAENSDYATVTNTVTNTSAYELPKTGGPGALPCRAAGLFLLAGGALALLARGQRRRKGARR